MQFVTANPRSNKLRRVPHGRVVTDGKIKNVSPHTHTHTDEIPVDERYIFPQLIPPMVVVLFIIIAN